jgi:hypothetical protein
MKTVQLPSVATFLTGIMGWQQLWGVNPKEEMARFMCDGGMVDRSDL